MNSFMDDPRKGDAPEVEEKTRGRWIDYIGWVVFALMVVAALSYGALKLWGPGKSQAATETKPAAAAEQQAAPVLVTREDVEGLVVRINRNFDDVRARLDKLEAAAKKPVVVKKTAARKVSTRKAGRMKRLPSPA